MYKLSFKYQWLIDLLKKDAHLLCGSLLLGLLGALLTLAMAVFLQNMIDVVIPKAERTLLIIAIFVMAAILLSRVLVNFIHGRLGALHSKRFNITVIDAFFKKLLYLPKSFFDANPTGTLITRMHDSRAIQETVAYFVNTLMLNFLTIIVSAIFLMYHSVPVGVLALISFPCFLFSALMYKNSLGKRFHEQYVAHGESESNFITSIQNSDLIKAHNKQAHFSSINFDIYGNFQRKCLSASNTGIHFGLTTEIIAAIFYVLMLIVLGYQAISGHITIGQFSATFSIATGLLIPISSLGNAVTHLQGANVAFDRMYEVLSAENEFESSEDDKKIKIDKITSINLQQVSFSYGEEKELFRNVSFNAEPGDLLCIYGKNGVGKSTVLNLIMSLYQPATGEISFNGIVSKDLSLVALRDRLAIVSQQSKLFAASLIENVCLSNWNETTVEAKSKLSSLGFDEFIRKIDGGYNAFVTEDGNNLSGGQRQLISLARALIKGPDVLLVDEPTSALDSDAENFVVQKLKEFSRSGGIVIMVSHRLKAARAANKIIVIEDATVGQIGTHEQLLKSDNFYSQRFKALLEA